MAVINFYSRPECHLCEIAFGLLVALDRTAEVTEVNIEDDLDLIRRYGERVPVLQRMDNQEELGWPFELDALKTFLGVEQ